MTEREMSVLDETTAAAFPEVAKLPRINLYRPEHEKAREKARAALLAIGYPPAALDQPASAWAVVPVTPEAVRDE